MLITLFNYKGINIDLKRYGHDTTSQGRISSLLHSLGIPRDFDVIIDGESMCLDYECWAMADAEYEACIAGDGDIELRQFTDTPFSIIPAAYAIADDYYDSDACDTEYDLMLRDECQIPCPQEVYVWDGTPITDVNSFFETNYPEFYARSASKCTFFIYDGTWVASSTKIGCVDFNFFMESTCTSASISSAKNVCETIGKTFICTDGDISCNG